MSADPKTGKHWPKFQITVESNPGIESLPSFPGTNIESGDPEKIKLSDIRSHAGMYDF
jgi:hypothetical protein